MNYAAEPRPMKYCAFSLHNFAAKWKQQSRIGLSPVDRVPNLAACNRQAEHEAELSKVRMPKGKVSTGSRNGAFAADKEDF
jgi:hypothetical protein